MRNSNLGSRIKAGGALLCHRLGLTGAGLRLGDYVRLTRPASGLRVHWKPGGAFLVLIYHRIQPSRRLFAIDTVPVKHFELQMRFLSRSFHVLHLEEIVERLRAGKALPRRCVAVTMDDGYEDNFAFAFPVLRELGLPATVFLTAGCIDAREPLWFDRVLHAFEHTERRSLTLPDNSFTMSFPSPEQRSSAAIRTLLHLISLPVSRRAELAEEVLSLLAAPEPHEQKCRLLTWSQVRTMTEQGISVGSHTMTHPVLSRMPLEDAERELTESKQLIEARTGKRVRLFAYPNGRSSDYSREVIDLVRKAGYDAAVTTVSGPNGRTQDPYQLRRIASWRQDLPSFVMTLTRHYLSAA